MHDDRELTGKSTRELGNDGSSAVVESDRGTVEDLGGASNEVDYNSGKSPILNDSAQKEPLVGQ